MSEWRSIQERLAGRWQLPLLAVSIALLGASVLRLGANPADLSPEGAIEYIQALVSGGANDKAFEYGTRVLDRPELTQAQIASVHLSLARAQAQEAKRRRLRSSGLGRDIVAHYKQAIQGGLSLTADDHARLGEALAWRRMFAAAVEQFGVAIEKGSADELPLRRRIISLTLDRLDVPAEQTDRALDQFFAKLDGDQLDLRLWAVETKLEVFDRLGRLAEASTLLARHRGRFEQTALEGRYQYLEGWVLYRSGHYDEAEVHLRAVLHRAEHGDEVSARAGWLLGRVVLEDGTPQRPLEALTFFTGVLDAHPRGIFAVVSRIGAAEALVMLERHDEALEAYRTAIDEVDALGHHRLLDRGVLRASLAVTAEAQRRKNQPAQAVGYAQLASSIVDVEDVEETTLLLTQLGRLRSLWAASLDRSAVTTRAPGSAPFEASTEAARTVFAQAASTFLEVARLNSLNERTAAEASWRAAELFARGGQRDRAGSVYRAFVQERPQHSLVPRALLRIGQLHQASGELSRAVETYQEGYRRFRRTLDGARALVPLARCYLAMGPDYADLAEKTLQIVLQDSDVFTPRVSEFADALFLMGESLKRRGAFGRAIATLEEALERYPEDGRVTRTRFLLADSYRQSGLALKADIADAKFAGESEQVRKESADRFKTARRFFRELIADYEARDPTTLERLDRVYLRLAYLYEADCYFETREYVQALKLYEEAAGMHKDTPSSLATYVQIINSHVFLGEPREARAALARALVLVDTIPDSAFTQTVSSEIRDDWKRYFEWLGKSELF